MEYQLEQIKNMRGFNALTQSESRLEYKLLDNINNLKGMKARGFNVTRKEVLTQEFDEIALDELIELSVDAYKNNMIGKNSVVESIAKKMCERVMRDFVPLDMVKTFEYAIAKMVESCSDGVEGVKKIIKHYFTCGTLVPVAETYREVEKSIQEGRILYYEPRKRID